MHLRGVENAAAAVSFADPTPVSSVVEGLAQLARGNTTEGLTVIALSVALWKVGTYANKARQAKAASNSWKIPLNVLDSCFPAGVPLLTPDGSKTIESFVVGDLVLSRDEDDPSGPVVAKRVAKVFRRVAPILHLRVRGQDIPTTHEHPYYVVGKGWLCASELSIGDVLASHTDATSRIEAITDHGEIATVYNLNIEDFHTYFVGCDQWGFSVWAHNADYQVFADAYGTHSIRYWEGTGSTRQLKVLETPLGDPIRFKTAAEADAWIARNAKFNDLSAVRPRSVDRVDLPAGTRVHQSGKLEGVALNEPQIFAVSENGQLIHAPRGNPRTGAKHTELTGGGPAKAAGEFKLVGENKIQINNQSGRYIRQSPEGVKRVADYFKNLGYEVEIVATPF